MTCAVFMRPVFALVFVGLLSLAGPSYAQTIIRTDGAHDYAVEVEVHGAVAPFSPPKGYADVGLGAGLRAGINLAPKGFLPMLNDSVALGVGVDYLHYFGTRPGLGACSRWRTTDQGGRLCVETTAVGGAGAYLYLPAVLQWNFYLTRDWSFFGEPGLALYFFEPSAPESSLKVGMDPTMSVGARWHFSDAASLTMRVGYPYMSAGVSFSF